MNLMLSFDVANHLWMISDYLRSSKLKALEGRPIIAPGKGEYVSAPPGVSRP